MTGIGGRFALAGNNHVTISSAAEGSRKQHAGPYEMSADDRKPWTPTRRQILESGAALAILGYVRPGFAAEVNPVAPPVLPSDFGISRWPVQLTVNGAPAVNAARKRPSSARHKWLTVSTLAPRQPRRTAAASSGIVSSHEHRMIVGFWRSAILFQIVRGLSKMGLAANRLRIY